MATPTVKTTYSLDLETVRAIEELARRWNVSRSEVLRRAIRASASKARPSGPRDAVRALDRLQDGLQLKAADAARWARDSRTERHAASRRREKPTP
jgi:Arc/MetJ-type ribon-helix-helix transcriptional regulator